MPACSRLHPCIHVWHMPALVNIFGDDACLQFVAAHWVNHGVTQRVRQLTRGTEACVEARNSGRELEKEARTF